MGIRCVEWGKRRSRGRAKWEMGGVGVSVEMNDHYIVASSEPATRNTSWNAQILCPFLTLPPFLFSGY